jgi:hypothetical protein
MGAASAPPLRRGPGRAFFGDLYIHSMHRAPQTHRETILLGRNSESRSTFPLLKRMRTPSPVRAHRIRCYDRPAQPRGLQTEP